MQLQQGQSLAALPEDSLVGFWWGHKDLNANSTHLVNLKIDTTGSETSNLSQRELKIKDCIMSSSPKGWEHGPTAGSGASGTCPGSGMFSILIHRSTSEHQGPLLTVQVAEHWSRFPERCWGLPPWERYSEVAWA